MVDREPVVDNTNGLWLISNDRKIQYDEITDDVSVSTVFLGIDHNHSGKGPPVLFETLVFGGPLDGNMDRYCTYSDAENGHLEMLIKVIDALDNP